MKVFSLVGPDSLPRLKAQPFVTSNMSMCKMCKRHGKLSSGHANQICGLAAASLHHPILWVEHFFWKVGSNFGRHWGCRPPISSLLSNLRQVEMPESHLWTRAAPTSSCAYASDNRNCAFGHPQSIRRNGSTLFSDLHREVFPCPPRWQFFLPPVPRCTCPQHALQGPSAILS